MGSSGAGPEHADVAFGLEEAGQLVEDLRLNANESWKQYTIVAYCCRSYCTQHGNVKQYANAHERKQHIFELFPA